ncbi:MAG: transposase [Segetibacter sp.]|nr:transposase [Segetibacter sp.]
MKESLVTKVSKQFAKRDKTCVKNLIILSMGILIKETVCLNKIKGAVGAITGKTTTQPQSHYKRLIRIFDEYSFSSLWLELLQVAFSLLRLKSEYLLLDGTSWQKGNRKIHYLTLCLVYQGVAIPIYWEDLQKKGTSNVKERKGIIRKAMKYYNLKSKILLADREYIGEEWFCFLQANSIDFVIRLRKKNYKQAVDAAVGKSYTALEKKTLRSRKGGKAVGKTIFLQGQRFTFVMVKNPKAEAEEALIYLLSSLEEAPACIAARYPIRWQIETCRFGDPI